jgi:hypothetical protein
LFSTGTAELGEGASSSKRFEYILLTEEVARLNRIQGATFAYPLVEHEYLQNSSRWQVSFEVDLSVVEYTV